MPDIFLSYCREDQEIARRFAEGLEQEGFDVWWDQALNAGESFDQVTERALKEARAVVVLWTPRSVQSRWVRSEATLADRYGTLVPVMLEPCDRPIMFELTHTADLVGWNRDRADRRWQSFIAGLRRQPGNASSAPAPAPRAASPSIFPRRTSLRLAAAAAGVILAAGLLWWLMRGHAGDPATVAGSSPARDIGHELGNLPGGLQDIASTGSGPAGMYRLTDFEGVEEQAAISPDGTLVAFISDRDGTNDVWITRIGTNEFRNLTQGRNIPQFSPETRVMGFSPDGSQVHFTGRINPEERSGNAWSVPVLGGAVRPLVDGAVEFAWSPDGRSLAYHTSEPGDPVSVRETASDGDRLLLVSAPGEHNHFPTWSPDGAFLYFLHGSNVLEGMEIWRVPAAGGTPEQLTDLPKPNKVVFPVFLDQRTLAFLAEESRGTGLTIHLLDVESRNVRTVRPGLERYTSLAASRSGRRLVATVSTQRSSLWSLPVGAGAVATQADRLRMSTRGGTSPRRLGNNLLYVSTSGAGSGLWRNEATSASEIWSPTRGSVVGAPAVEPGGHRIAFSVLRDGMTRLFVGNADGTGMRALAADLQVRGSPAWSPDGKWIAIGVETAEGVRLYRIPVDGGEPMRLTDHHAVDPTWSPQGGFVVYSGEQVGPILELAAVTSDGQPHAIPSIRLPRGAGRTLFFPGTDAAPQLLVRKGDLQSTEFWVIDLITGKERQLTRFGIGYQLGDFDLSPDGREILFDRVREESDVVLIDLG